MSRWFGFVLISASVGSSLILSACCPAQRVDENDKSEYIHIRSFDGILNPVDGRVHAEVYALDRRPTSGTDDPQTQNLIELVTASGTFRYRWPDQFVGGWCEVVDLDGDGWREFAFVGLTRARVVSFRQGAFQFRSREDVLIAHEPIRLIDSNGDDKLEFVTAGPSILDPAQFPASAALISWEKNKGFGQNSP
jgi:hypothetical protein